MYRLMRTLFAALIVFPATLAAQDEASAAALTEARQVAEDLTTHLRQLLGKEMAQGGVASAVRVCADVALQTTRDFSTRKGRYVRRVSLRNRNPENVPDARERRMLMLLADQHRAGKLPPESSEVIAEPNGARMLVYFKPIVTAPMCTTCHGPAEGIPPEVKRVLADRYPRDTATGYAPGDLRGAIAVRIPLPLPPR
jgi:hypothetical protein